MEAAVKSHGLKNSVVFEALYGYVMMYENCIEMARIWNTVLF